MGQVENRFDLEQEARATADSTEKTVINEKSGYMPATVEAIDASKDVNVGDIELHQEAVS